MKTQVRKNVIVYKVRMKDKSFSHDNFKPPRKSYADHSIALF